MEFRRVRFRSDAEMAASDFVRLVLANIGTETDAWGVSRIPTYAAQSVNSLSAHANRVALSDQWEEGLRSLLASAEPDSDHQLTFARSYAAAAQNASALDDLEERLDGALPSAGLADHTTLPWLLIGAQARAVRLDAAPIAARPPTHP